MRGWKHYIAILLNGLLLNNWYDHPPETGYLMPFGPYHDCDINKEKDDKK